MSTNYLTVAILVTASLWGQQSSKFHKLDGRITNGVYNAAMFNFPAKIPSTVSERTLTASVGATLTFTAAMGGCPYGVAGADANHYLYISGGVGTAEAVLITGGTCTGGAASGTVTFTPANNHSGTWTIASGSGGIHEALLAAGSGGAVHVPTGAYSIYAPVILIAGEKLYGDGTVRTAITNMSCTTDAIKASGGGGRNVSISDLEIIDNCSLGSRSAGNGITLDGSTGGVEGVVRDVTIGGHYNGVSITGALKSNVSNVRVTSCKNDGFQVMGSSTSTAIIASYANGCGRDGFHQQSSQYISYLSTASDGNTRDGYHFDTSNFTTTLSTVGSELNTRYGICIDHSASSGYGFLLNNITSSTNGSDNIFINGTSNVIINGGVAFGSTGGWGLNLNPGTGTSVIEFGLTYSGNFSGTFTDPNNRLGYSFGHNLAINSVAIANYPLFVQGNDNQQTAGFVGSATAGKSYGPVFSAGTNSSDESFRIRNQSGGSSWFIIRGDGQVTLGTGTLVLSGLACPAGQHSTLTVDQSGVVTKTGCS